jgi:hypothetical protein
MTAQKQLTSYINLLAELAKHYSDEHGRIPVFLYSDELADYMHEIDTYDPNAAFVDLASIVNDLAHELAVQA